MNSLTAAQLERIADPEHGWKFGFTRQMASELLALRGALHALVDNLSLAGCCPANNCESQDANGLDGLREPDPLDNPTPGRAAESGRGGEQHSRAGRPLQGLPARGEPNPHQGLRRYRLYVWPHRQGIRRDEARLPAWPTKSGQSATPFVAGHSGVPL